MHSPSHPPTTETLGPPSFSLRSSVPRSNFSSFLSHNSDAEPTFVIAAVDPDAPTPQDPTNAQIRHFLGGNFRLDGKLVLRNSTPAVTEFHQPTPPAGSDAHR